MFTVIICTLIRAFIQPNITIYYSGNSDIARDNELINKDNAKQLKANKKAKVFNAKNLIFLQKILYIIEICSLLKLAKKEELKVTTICPILLSRPVLKKN